MNKNKSQYESLSWVDSLKSLTKKADYSSPNDPEDITNATERTIEAAFSVPTTEETNKQKITRASREQSVDLKISYNAGLINELKEKLASKNIDPVALGVITAEKWKDIDDLEDCQKLAYKAALAYEKAQNQAWEKKAMNPRKMSFAFDEKAMSGHITTSRSASEDCKPQNTRTPFNTASILNPERIDQYAQAENAHDARILAERKAKADRLAHKKSELVQDVSKAEIMQNSQILGSGSTEREVFQHRVPKNQLSILDNLAGSGDWKQKLETLFANRIPDTKTQIREANKERKAEIRGTDESRKDRSWDTVEHLKPTSTSELQNRLMQAWMPPEPGK